MPDLRTTYLGLELRTPIVASPSPLNGTPESARRVEDAGAAAIVLPSLFEEEILHEELQLSAALDAGAEQYAEALDYFPAVADLAHVGDRYLATLEEIRRGASVPVIASLNATSAGGWVRYARLLADAGADAIELNLYHLAADPHRTAVEMEATDLTLIEAVCDAVEIPVAVKLSPYYSAMANFASRAAAAGASGLVLFNRFYQPDLDLETLEVVPRVELSRPGELRLPLRWIAILRPQLGPHVGLAATSGVHSGTDVVKSLLVGADVAMLTSAVLHHGPQHFRTVEAELVAWLEEHEYESVAQLRGSASHHTAADPSAFERANYVRTLHSWSG
jgi:dihydroorotate dehydrogenase (fumarate)